MVKRKSKIDPVNVLKTSKKTKLDNAVKGIKDITSLFDSIKKQTKDIAHNDDSISKASMNDSSSSRLTNDGIPTNRKSTKKSSGKDGSLKESRIYGIINSSVNPTIVNPEAPLERIDKDSGLPVYKAHLLKVGEGGGKMVYLIYCNLYIIL